MDDQFQYLKFAEYSKGSAAYSLFFLVETQLYARACRVSGRGA